MIELCRLPEKPLDGQSLVPLLENPALETNRTVKTHVSEGNYALSSKEWRYIRYADGSEELYNLTTDPREYDNLISKGDYSVVVKSLKKNTR